MTIKKRIVIWYTIWMAFLVIIASVILFSASGIFARREALSDLEEVVHDAREDIYVRDGRIWTDDLDFFDDGVYLSIWQNSEMIMGLLPENAPSSPFVNGVFQYPESEKGSWYYLDLELGAETFVRGVFRAYDMGTFVSSMQVLLLILLPFVVLLAALGGYIIVRRSFKPADAVIATAGEIADSDDLSKRIGLGNGNDEIHEMASAFDSMMDRIESAFEKEKQFTSDASHELRTPIAVILAEAEYASSHTADEDKMKDSLAVISHQGEKMSRLVSELLTIARSDKGTLKLNPEFFDLGELGEMTLSAMEDQAEKKGITLSLKAEKDMIVEADQSMIARVIINFVANAINYGRNNGWVILRITQKSGMAVIAVEDNGIGISRDHLERIWDRFYQVDSSRSMDSSGAGLGLSIVKEIVTAHGGSVSVESIEGLGSMFTAEIPMRQNK